MNKYFLLDKDFLLKKPCQARVIAISDKEFIEEEIENAKIIFNVKDTVVYHGIDIPYFIEYNKEKNRIEEVISEKKLNIEESTKIIEEVKSSIFDETVEIVPNIYYFYIDKKRADEQGISEIKATFEKPILDPLDYFSVETYMVKGDTVPYYVTYDNSIREATKYERYIRGQYLLESNEVLFNNAIYALKEGEVFDGKKIISMQKPSKYHEWNGIEWFCDLNRAKELKRTELKEIREQKQNEDFEFKGHLFQATEKDMRNIETKYNSITMLDKLGQDIKPYLSQKMRWTLKDNSQIDMLVRDILQLYIAWDNRRTEVFNYCNNVLYKQLEDAETVEQIEAITWE